MTSNNENRPGYKNTKIGWIPDDWEVGCLDDLGNFSKGAGIAKKDTVENGIPCVRYGEIYTTHHYYIKKYCSFIAEKTIPTTRKLKKNDILFVGSGETREEIGKAVAFLNDDEVYAGGDIIIFSPKSGLSLLLSYILNNEIVNRQKFKMGQGHSVVHIYANHLKKLLLPLPPLPEQKKIAEILSTWDKAISKYDTLISKYELRKKALMQKLLTGKVRFKEFDEQEWKEVRIRDFGKVVTGSTPPMKDENNYGIDYCWVTAQDFTEKYIIKSKIMVSEQGSKFCRLVPEGSILITCIASIGLNAIAGTQLGTNQQINSIIVNENFNNEFIYYLIEFNKNLMKSYAGQTAVPIINKNTFENIKLFCPKMVEEQRKIASVLTAQDKQIDLLKKQKAALEQQKKGLMQKLLTGEVRVRVN